MTGLTLQIEPRTALVDEVVRVRVASARPGARVSLGARTTGTGGQPWTSAAVFRADDLGRVDVPLHEPLEGSYAGADPMGPFWSMRPAAGDTADRLVPAPGCSSVDVVLSAAEEGGPPTHSVVTRQFRRTEVERADVRAAGLVGTFFRPHDAPSVQGVLVLAGSDGRIPEDLAGLLASHRLATLAIAYFGTDPLPADLVEVPLEYVETAIAWLRAQDGVQPGVIHVVGRSRGGELALLAGAMLAGIGSVVAYVPSGVTWWGWTMGGWSPSPAWTYRGRGLPCPGSSPGPGFEGTTGPAFFRQILRLRPRASRAATVPVEEIDGDVLLVSGGDDQVWPSTALAAIAGERRAMHHRACRHLDYPAAGHMISYPHVPTTVTTSSHPTTGRRIDLGGAARANAQAAADSWPHVLCVLGGCAGPG